MLSYDVELRRRVTVFESYDLGVTILKTLRLAYERFLQMYAVQE